MSIDRTFPCTVAQLLAAGRRLHGALLDPQVGPPVVARLKDAVPEESAAPDFPSYLDGLVAGVSGGGAKQAGAAGAISTLTKEQSFAYAEMERLVSGARRSANLAFPGQDALLHAEFKVGVHEPRDLASELERAALIAAGSVKYAAALSQHGWIAQDAQELSDAIQLLSGKDADQEASEDRKKGLTALRNRQANLLYAAIQTTQNAARLANPAPSLAWSKASRKPAPASSSTSSPRAEAETMSRQ